MSDQWRKAIAGRGDVQITVYPSALGPIMTAMIPGAAAAAQLAERHRLHEHDGYGNARRGCPLCER